MIIEGLRQGLLRLVFRQLDGMFGLSEVEKGFIEEHLGSVLNRCEFCFKHNSNKYYSKLDAQGELQVYFNPLQSAQYTIFLYYLSNTLSSISSGLADKVYYLNKALNACDLYHQVILPEIFMLDHPVGSVMGRAEYGNYFSFGQNCTVGNNNGIYPIIGEHVRMCMSSAIVGKCIIGNNVILGAACLVKDTDIPDNTIVFGQSPNLILKSNEKHSNHTGTWRK